MGNRLRVWGPAVAWAAVLFTLSAIPNAGSLARLPVSDKVVHAGLYLVLGTALAWGWARAPRPVAHLLLLLVGALYAGSDEWHQVFVPGRTPDVRDWAADMVGLLIGYGTTVRVAGRSERGEEASTANEDRE